MAREDNLNKDPDIARERGKLGGRPKGALSMTTVLKRMIEQGEVEMKIKKIKKNKDGTTTTYYDTVRVSPELIHSGVLKKACAGNTRAYELIMDRMEGKPEQTTKNINVNTETENKFDKLSLEELEGIKKKLDKIK